ncbi:uncharacterized protein I303_101534 [Kwoniella dejecticola CBS 10117]|uniref:CFEM domain-containing protein n=1 Tax=Kwoniella dejecticola CBS 10117 TaxID=1296121 RepID=A0A1A6ADH5_9TREE|nr:uncharacterized protein I303_02334 [Kwoniella dejecticola CBS 10117]OBR88115.1 hypothetical protein I303_02334 [Kwoniella dejecticola CBS 10117]
MKFTVLASIALASLVSAQTIPECVLTCSTQAAAAAGCSSYTDVTCVCTNADFQNAATSCLTANCTTADQTAALSLQSALCAGQSVTGGSLTASITASGSASIDASAIASLTQSGASGSAAATSLVSSASASASAASAASASGSASGSASRSGSASASGSATSAAASAASSAPASAGNKLEVSFKGLVGSAVGVVGLLAGAVVAL